MKCFQNINNFHILRFCNLYVIKLIQGVIFLFDRFLFTLIYFCQATAQWVLYAWCPLIQAIINQRSILLINALLFCLEVRYRYQVNIYSKNYCQTKTNCFLTTCMNFTKISVYPKSIRINSSTILLPKCDKQTKTYNFANNNTSTFNEKFCSAFSFQFLDF